MGLFERKNVWYIDYFFDGKRIKKAISPNKKEARAVLGKTLSAIREGRFLDVKQVYKTTMEEAVDKFREWAKTKKSYKSNYAVHLPCIMKHFGTKKLTDITEYDIEQWRGIRIDTPAIRGGKQSTKNPGKMRSPTTVNHELKILKQIFNKSIAWGLTDRNPAAKVKKLPEPTGRTRFLTLDEAEALLKAASPHLRPILIMALETGMRRGEIMSLKWQDVDMKNRTLFLGTTKNGTSRHVPMSERLWATLAALPRPIHGEYVFVGQPKINKGRKIGKPGEPFHDVSTSFETACAKAGIQGFRFHDLRHTAASYMVMNGAPLRTVGDILGHKTMAMTERYSHLTLGHKKQAVELLPDWESGEACVPNVSQSGD